MLKSQIANWNSQYTREVMYIRPVGNPKEQLGTYLHKEKLLLISYPEGGTLS